MSNSENAKVKRSEKPEVNVEEEEITRPDVQEIEMPDEELLWERRFKRQCRG